MKLQTKRKKQRKSALQRVSTALLSLMLSAALCAGVLDYIVPSSVGIMHGDGLPQWLHSGITLDIGETARPAFADELNNAVAASALCTTETATAKLLGVLPLKQVTVHEIADRQVLPGGMLFGVRLYTKGLLVIGMHDIETANGAVCPAKDAGIRVRDMITAIDDRSVTTGEEFSAAIEQSGGNTLSLTVTRDGKKITLPVTPVKATDNCYKTGIYVRDNTSGIGTVTFIDSSTGVFCGLGHGICDTDTGVLLPLGKGTLMGVVLNRVRASTPGNPGELSGYFAPDKTGNLVGNTNAGVFGVFTETPPSPDPVSIGLKGEVTCGPAQIYATAEKDGKCRAYNVEILRLTGENSENKNFILSVTDEKLLALTGGIVQGMSGSPVIQNGKLVGAVTHVLVNDPTRGYGIFIENMLSNMPELLQ